jgi:uncharacterized membrane protein YjfL (UPF0719 family)
MNSSLFFVGIGKVLFGIVVGALGIFFASRALGKLLRWGNVDAEIQGGNVAAGVLKASSLIALGVLVQHAITATFSAMDLLYRGQAPDTSMLLRFAAYGLAHVSFSLAASACVLALGAWIFNHLTRGVDEMAEVRKGNVAPSLVLGAVMIVMALVTAPGLQMALEGLLPLPTLARDEMVAPT